MQNETTKKRNCIKCKKCGGEILSNTHKKMIYCECESIAVDGCEDYIRVIGNERDYEIIKEQ